MPADIPYGRLVDHISKYFGSRKMFGRLGELEQFEHTVKQELHYAGLDPTDAIGIQKMRFDKLPRATRERLLAKRAGLFGLEELFGDEQLVGQFVREGGTGRFEGGAFRTVKEASLHESGWGFFDIPSSQVLEAARAGDVDRVASLVAYSTLNPQVYLSGELGMPASMLREQAARHTAQQLKDLDSIRGASRLIFDVETTGLTRRDEVWQLSAKLMRGDTELDTITLHIPTERMNLGLYKHGDQYMRAQDFISALYTEQGRGAPQWIDDVGGGLKRLMDMADKAEYLVAHNAPFDVEQIEKMITRLGRSKRPDGFDEGAKNLLKKMKSDSMIDTASLARLLIDDISFAGKDPKPFSLENIVQQTDLVDRLVEKHGAKEIRAKLVDVGAHNADIDTWLTNEFLSDLLERHPDRAAVTGNAVKEATEIRELIRERSASAITPTATQLKELDDLTPLQFLARETRDFGTTPFRTSDAMITHVGMFDDWVNSIITQQGDIRFGTGLLDDFAHIPGVHEALDTLQSRAVKAGLPFAGLSAPERLLSTVIGRHVSRWAPEELNRARTLMGDLTGGGLVRATETARVFGQDKNVALPMEIIMRAEQEEALTTRFSRALEGTDAVQTARWSPFTWGEGQQRDVALVADAFENAADADKFMQWLNRNYQDFGISEDVMAAIKRAHKSGNMEKYGIQLGVMGGRGQRSVEMVANLMEQLGFGLDQGGQGLRTPVFKSADGFIHTAATFIGGLGDIPEEDLLRQVRAASELTDFTVEQGGTVAGRAAALLARTQQESGAGLPIFKFLTEHLPGVRPRHIGIGAAALAGYYVFRGNREQAPFDETIEEQGFEDPMFYDRYRQEMGLPQTDRHRIRPLDTASVVNDLDRTKTRHHQMGPNKYNHLYGG